MKVQVQVQEKVKVQVQEKVQLQVDRWCNSRLWSTCMVRRRLQEQWNRFSWFEHK